jgi:FKBP-type peptidyl-prolyl cis-trans isomerase SlyD
MRIRPGCLVGLDYVLRLDDGQVVDASSPEAPLLYVHGEGQILARLEQALDGLRVGERRELLLDPDEGFGEGPPRAIEELPRAAFPAGTELTPGEEVVLQGPGGEKLPLRIVAVEGNRVAVDVSLTGRRLRLDVTVREVRAPPRPEPSAPDPR